MTRFSQITLAAALAAASFAANASTLVMEFGGSTTYNFDNTHSASYKADLEAIATSEARFGTFEGYLVINNYENYLTGTHTLTFGGNVASNDVQFSLFSGLVYSVEGTNANPTKPNPNYQPGVQNCTTSGGCDFDNDGVKETPRNNNPTTVSGGYSVLPNNKTWGNGTVTLVNGKVFSLEYDSVATAGSLAVYNSANWSPSSTNAADTINRAVLASRGWDTRVASIDVVLNNTSAARLVGGSAALGTAVYVANGLDGQAVVNMTQAVAAVPEPETYAMLLAGLGVVGFSLRRRMNKSA
ncbi:MAG: PEP-CTERM sorting domain-containing protein [Pseudomonadota bacterium]